MASEGTKTKKEKYVSNQEDVINNAKLWLNNNRPLTNDEMKEWVISNYAFVRGISRTKYSARIVVMGENGENEIIVSLPRKQISQ